MWILKYDAKNRIYKIAIEKKKKKRVALVTQW